MFLYGWKQPAFDTSFDDVKQDGGYARVIESGFGQMLFPYAVKINLLWTPAVQSGLEDITRKTVTEMAREALIQTHEI